MRVQAFDPNKIDEVVTFCLRHPIKPFHNERLIRRFFTALTSGPSMIFDLHDDDERIAVGVLLDKVKNVANCANIEVLAIDTNKTKAGKAFLKMIELAKAQLPAKFDGIELGFYPGATPLSEDELTRLGFELYYQCFDMMTSSPIVPSLDLTNWKRLELKDFDLYYSTLSNAFSKNVESSVPGRDAVLKGLESKTAPLPFVCHLDSRIAAFTSVSIDERSKSGEIMTVGTHEDFRGRGLGREGLAVAISELTKRGAKSLKLTVEAKNENALNLYKKFGFEIIERSRCLKYSRT